jgi:oligopeptidase A
MGDVHRAQAESTVEGGSDESDTSSIDKRPDQSVLTSLSETRRTGCDEPESLVDTEETLSLMFMRLSALLDSPLTDHTFVELTAIYDNVAYIFLYLESNEAHIDYRRLLSWRSRFFDNSSLDSRVCEALGNLRCLDAEVEQARQAYLSHLQSREASKSEELDDRLVALQQNAKEVLASVEDDHQRLLVRLGIGSSEVRAWPQFYRLMSSTDSAATRCKLNQVWLRTRDAKLASLVDLVNQMMRTRRERAAKNGFDTVLCETLTRCRLSESAASEFIDEYLSYAIANHQKLDAEIRDALATAEGGVSDHFGCYVQTVAGSEAIPLFDLGACLEFIFRVATVTFGLKFSEIASGSEHVVRFQVYDDGRMLGVINFDLWNTQSTPKAYNSTRGIRNRTEWSNLVQHPIAYVSCRFVRSQDGPSRINLQNVHSLFHEFGHALNHLLIRRRLPTRSGLDFLPLERLENLSMWFEKWIYNPDFTKHVAETPDAARRISTAQRVKLLEYRRTHLERGVTAALDFEVHRGDGLGIRGAFENLDRRFGLQRYCNLGDFPAYFTWPMFQAHPGANFAYLWGSADSCEKFMPFMSSSISRSGSPNEVRKMFADSFDFDLPSRQPDPAAIFSFYDVSRVGV